MILLILIMLGINPIAHNMAIHIFKLIYLPNINVSNHKDNVLSFVLINLDQVLRGFNYFDLVPVKF
jgi:hypothetical protein